MKNIEMWSNRFPDLLEVKTFIESTGERAEEEPNQQVGRIAKADIEAALTQDGSRVMRKSLILLCGPEPMISYLAGPKGRDQSQGPIAGVLTNIDDEKYDVWKL